MRAARTIASAVALVAALTLGSLAPAGADTTAVSYLCDLPDGATGALASQIPDTITSDFDVTVQDSPDPVLSGGTTHLDLDVPFPDFTSNLPALPLGQTYGYFYIRQIDVLQPLPTGIDLNSVVTTLTPAPNWATVAREGNNLRLHVQSAVLGSYIRVNPDASPPTIEVETARGTWTPLNFIPSVDLDATVTGAPGSTLDWRPPTLNAVVKYSKNIFLVLNVNWNDANLPCDPVNPSQTLVSTLVASPSMSASLARTEATVPVGGTIHYTATVQNTGDVPLTGITVSVPNATCAAPPASVAVGASADVACTHTAAVGDIGTYTRSATVDSAETASATTNSVSTTVEARRRADATAATASGGPFTGDGTYSATVTTGQTVKGGVARGGSRSFYVQVGNDGDATDSFTVRGVDSGAAGYKVTYFDAAGVNITAAVKAGTYAVPGLAPGATTTLRVKIKATTTSARGSSHNADVTVTPSGSPGAADVVRAKAKRT